MSHLGQVSRSRVPVSIVNETLGRNPDYHLSTSCLETSDAEHHEPDSVGLSKEHRGTAGNDLWLNGVILPFFSLLYMGEDLNRSVLVELFVFYTQVKQLCVSYLRPRLLRKKLPPSNSIARYLTLPVPIHTLVITRMSLLMLLKLALIPIPTTTLTANEWLGFSRHIRMRIPLM